MRQEDERRYGSSYVLHLRHYSMVSCSLSYFSCSLITDGSPQAVRPRMNWAGTLQALLLDVSTPLLFSLHYQA